MSIFFSNSFKYSDTIPIYSPFSLKASKGSQFGIPAKMMAGFFSSHLFSACVSEICSGIFLPIHLAKISFFSASVTASNPFCIIPASKELFLSVAI